MQTSEMKFKIGKLLSVKKAKESNDWTLFSLKFDVKGNEEEFTAFDTIGKKGKGLQIKDLKENTEYNIGYVENEKDNAIKWINIYTPKNKTSPTQKTQKIFNGNSGDINNVVFDKKFEKYLDFNLEYLDNMESENKEINCNHYIGYFIRTHKQELNLTELVEWLVDMYKKEVENRPKENKVIVEETEM
jgi:hypothetical protein